MYHPESMSQCNHCPSSPSAEAESPHSVSPLVSPEDGGETRVLTHSSVLSHLLSENIPHIKYPDSEHKSSGRALTSAENLKKLDEKRREKEAAEEEKQRRKEEREQK